MNPSELGKVQSMYLMTEFFIIILLDLFMNKLLILLLFPIRIYYPKIYIPYCIKMTLTKLLNR